MSFHALAPVLGWVAVGVGLVGTAAQFRRLHRRGLDGVSVATWVLFVLMGGFWITYGAVDRSWTIVMGSLIVLPLQLGIVLRLRPWRHGRTVVTTTTFFLVSCVLPTVLWGWPGGVYGTGVAMMVNRGPQLLELVREVHAAGVSVGSWALGSVGSVLWVAYYSGAHLWAALAATAVAGLANVTITLLAWWRHREAMATREMAEALAV